MNWLFWNSVLSGLTNSKEMKDCVDKPSAAWGRSRHPRASKPVYWDTAVCTAKFTCSTIFGLFGLGRWKMF